MGVLAGSTLEGSMGEISDGFLEMVGLKLSLESRG